MVVMSRPARRGCARWLLDSTIGSISTRIVSRRLSTCDPHHFCRLLEIVVEVLVPQEWSDDEVALLPRVVGAAFGSVPR